MIYNHWITFKTPIGERFCPHCNSCLEFCPREGHQNSGMWDNPPKGDNWLLLICPLGCSVIGEKKNKSSQLPIMKRGAMPVQKRKQLNFKTLFGKGNNNVKR